MKHEPIQRPAPKSRDSLGADFALIAEALVDAFRGLRSASRLESRWSQLRFCGCSY